MEAKIFIYGRSIDPYKGSHSVYSILCNASNSPFQEHFRQDGKKEQGVCMGHRENKTHHLHLTAWDTICMPKARGDLGLKKLADMNKAYLTKLAWHLTTSGSKIWVQLIKSKYLRGSQILDVQRSHTTVSWIWGSILHNVKILQERACYQLGVSSTLRIKGEPWISAKPDFRIPHNLELPPHINLVWDLMAPDGCCWNTRRIHNIFPSPIREYILHTPIHEMEQDNLVWTPSATGRFTIKSTQKFIMQRKGYSIPSSTSKQWNILWASKLQNRHKILFWKIMNNAMPTLDRLQRFMQIRAAECYLY